MKKPWGGSKLTTAIKAGALVEGQFSKAHDNRKAPPERDRDFRNACGAGRLSPYIHRKGRIDMSDDADATGVNNVSGTALDAEAKKKTGKTMEQLTEEKRKELDEKIKKGGDENIKYAKPGRSDILP